MFRVTADANIFISGLNFKGKPFDLLTLARRGVIELAISDAILNEIKRVLRIKFHWPDQDIAELERQISSFTRHVYPEQAVDAVKDDESDNRILECAVAARSHFVVTGDHHLLDLEHFGPIRIVKVADLLAYIGRVSP